MSEPASGARFGVSDEDWFIVLEGRANVLLVGPELIVAPVIAAMRPFFESPIRRWAPGEPATLPCQTLLVEDADRLTLAEQRQLDDRLASLSEAQVVSLSSVPLFPLVEQGKFLASLYYRLNIVYLTFVSDAVR
jgi:hypothetical protein